MPVLSSYVRDHAALPRMSANADFSTLLKCLASGKKSIEQLRPSAPRQTLALELLEVYCFRILLVYPCALYYGMLILSRAHGACPTPPDNSLIVQQWIPGHFFLAIGVWPGSEAGYIHTQNHYSSG